MVIICDAARPGSAVLRLEDRLADVGVPDPVTVVTRTDGHADADATVQTLENEWPTVGDDDAFEGFAAVLEATVCVEVEHDGETGLRAKLPL